MARTMLISLMVLLLAVALFPQQAEAALSYGQPSLTKRPNQPHVLGNQGDVVSFDEWKLTIAPDTFSYDVYFRYGCWDKSFPKRLGRYWQISDICEFFPKSHFNRADAEIQKQWIISYKYHENDLIIVPGLTFPEGTLKIVYSPDNGESWEMLRSSVVDVENNTVAAISKGSGGYMIMTGFVSPNTFYNYSSSVLGVQSDKPANEPTLTDNFQGFLEGILFRTAYTTNKVIQLVR